MNDDVTVVSLCRDRSRTSFLEIVDHPAGRARIVRQQLTANQTMHGPVGIPETRFHFFNRAPGKSRLWTCWGGRPEVLRLGRVGKTCTALCALWDTPQRTQMASLYNISGTGGSITLQICSAVPMCQGSLAGMERARFPLQVVRIPVCFHLAMRVRWY